MRLALGLMNATIGDVAGDGARIESLRKWAEAAPLSGELANAAMLVGPGGRGVGQTICEDSWNDMDSLRQRRLYREDPGGTLLWRGAGLIRNVSASPEREVSTRAFGIGRRIPIVQVSKA